MYCNIVHSAQTEYASETFNSEIEVPENKN